MKQFIHFVFFEGSILIGLFFAVTLILVLVRDRFSSDEMNERLARLPLVRGSVYATILGAITPFCSCSTVPIFSGMLRSNIRFGISFTFLLASPLVSEIVIIIMMWFLGLKFTLAFVLLASVFPILFGILYDKLNFAALLREGQIRYGKVPGYVKPHDNAPIPFKARLRFASLISTHELKSVIPHLTIGLLVGGAIYGFVPKELVLSVGNKVSEPVLIILMALMGIPLYLNMAVALPVGVALIEKGIGIGPVIALLVTGSGTSVTEMILLLKLFKPRLLAYFIAAVTISAICMGFFFSYVLRYFN